jgi:hypothetical protein
MPEPTRSVAERRFVARIALLTALLIGATGCTTTQYRAKSDESEVRLTGRLKGEKLLKRVDREVRHHFFLFGIIPYERELDIARELKLKPGQALVNTRIESSFGGIDALVFIGGAALSYGLLPAVWTTRTTTIRGDIVETEDDDETPATPAAKAEGPAVGPPAPPSPAVAPIAAAPKAATWIELDEQHNRKGAAEECAKRGGRLPTRAELKKHRELLGKGGDVWSADLPESDDDDDGGKSREVGESAWSYNLDAGAAFLKSPGDRLGVVCIQGGTNAK